MISLKKFLVPLMFVVAAISYAQQLPVNCNLAIPGCSTPSFAIF
jgi:hypothetical protein